MIWRRFTATCAAQSGTCVARRKTRYHRVSRRAVDAVVMVISISLARTPDAASAVGPRQSFRASTAASAVTLRENARKKTMVTTYAHQGIYRARHKRSTWDRSVLGVVLAVGERVDEAAVRRLLEDMPRSTVAIITDVRRTLEPIGRAVAELNEVSVGVGRVEEVETGSQEVFLVLKDSGNGGNDGW